MDDNRIIVLLTRKITGEMSELELEELTDLLAKNPDAVYYEEFVKELWAKNEEVKQGTASFYEKHKAKHLQQLDFIPPIGNALQPAIRNKRRVMVPKRWMRYGSAAFLLCILCVAFFFYDDHKKEMAQSKIEVVAAKGVRKQLVLPDGTKVWLNADSRLAYNDFSKDGKTRAVNLVGEAYFDVAKDENKPFIIQTKKVSIRVLGTAFNVKAYPNEPKTETTLIKGAIELSVNERPDEKIRLKPNEKVEVIDANMLADGRHSNKHLTLQIGVLSKIHIDDQEYIKETSWTSDKLVFKDETLEELVPKLERWYNVRINMQQPQIKNYRYTATITRENIEQVLQAMQLIKPFNFKRVNHDILIY